MRISKSIKTSIWLICINLAYCTTSAYGQLINGGFEDWYFADENKEYPAGWYEYHNNTIDAISKSTNAHDGLYAVNVASLNFVEGTYSPAYLGAKYMPTGYNLKFSFYYLIDSIEAQSNAVVNFLQRNSDGDYKLFKSVKYNEVTSSYIQEEIEIAIENLDTLKIVLVAENEEKIAFGWQGFISVLFDDITIEQISSTSDIPNLSCNVSALINGNSMLLPENCNQYNRYVIFSPLGQIISEGRILENTIAIPNIGLQFVSLISDSNDTQVLKILKF